MLLVSVLQDLGEQALEESIGVVSMGHYLLHPIPQSGEPLLSKPRPKMHVAEELPKDQSWHPLASCDGIPGVIPDAMTRVRQRDHMQVEVMDHEEQGTPSNGPLINGQLQHRLPDTGDVLLILVSMLITASLVPKPVETLTSAVSQAIVQCQHRVL